ncbi:efflux RND transporter permease subunit [Novosphingobium guangzhouense]|uniref:Multidrug transporter subunit MdtC n=1 Tax=Novosphingobium guangzhouense TaxID=1850347 RepID=A0A2K2G3L9_9SPHN|nr:efflux RND transporter permease subunit [Novosphingobium guangzhouense]PNU05588.1 multidrug transporter subunit MdtC [Novosphingobium guangzhouense]
MDTNRANPSRLFIERPVATTLFMIAILLAGLVGYRALPLSALPEVDYPTIQVTASYPGAGPDVMGATVTAPLERQFGQMAGLQRMKSVSSAGASVITLQFGLAETLDVAEQEVQAAINAANALLPADLPAPPVYAKVNPADAPVMTLAFTSKTRSMAQVQDLVDRRVAAKIAQMPGVGQVTLAGGQRPALRVQADVAALAARGLSLEQLRSAITNANVNAAKGSLDGKTRSWIIDANDQLQDAAAYRKQIVRFDNGAAVRIGDVARVVDGQENLRVAGAMDGRPAIVLDIRRQPGGNVVAVTDAIRKALPDLQAALPADVHVRLLADRTLGIRASVHDVQVELVLAVVLVMAAIFLFLGDIRATLVASVSVPISIVGTFAAMQMLGFSLNNLTLMALTIASGFVVDDAIVVIENIQRHREDGLGPFEAALKGSAEIGFTIVSLTVSLIAVLIPLLFMGDVVGRLFREFAITLAVTILISAVVALTLTPMLSARWLKPEGENRLRFAAWTHRLFERMAGGYEHLLGRVLRQQHLTLGIFAASVALTGLLFLAIPKGLFPQQDSGQLQAIFTADQGISFRGMAALQQRVSQAILEDPAVASVSSGIGVDSQNPSLNQGRMQVNLKPRSEREGQDAVIQSLRQRVAAVPGLAFHVRAVEDLTIDTETGPTAYRFVLQGAEQAVLDDWSARLIAALRQDAGGTLSSLSCDVQANGNGVTVAVDRDAAARLGISAAAVDAALYDAFGQRIVSTVFTQANQYRVILESAPGTATRPDMLAGLYLPTGGGGQIPLSTVARFEAHPARLTINRIGQFPAVTVGFDLAPGKSLGGAVSRIEAARQRIGMPAAISLGFVGSADAFRASLANQGWLILAAVAVVYIVLGVLYESYVHPLTILSTLPSAGVGALLALMLAGQDLGVIGIIGIVLLIGIVKKNAIMMIDFALDAQRSEGKDADTAIREAARLRFRPIMMTTFAALMAALPMIFGQGTGSELRLPLGLSIAGGLLVSQALTLFTTPVIFLAFERIKARCGNRQKEAA